MKKTVKFDLFGDSNQYLMFNSVRLAELEQAVGPIEKLDIQAVGMTFILKALPIAMKQHYHNETEAFYGEKLDDYFDRTGNDRVSVAHLIIRAIFEAGGWGSERQAAVLAALDAYTATVSEGETPKNESRTEATAKPSRRSKAG